MTVMTSPNGTEPQTFPCKTPGCDGEARSRSGRHSYCVGCQVRRGTRTPDGRFVSGLIPTAPGSRSGRNSGGRGPIEQRAWRAVAAARRLEHALDRHRGIKADIEAGLEVWKQQARLLVAAGRELDAAIRRREKIAVEFERGLREWAKALDELNELPVPARR